MKRFCCCSALVLVTLLLPGLASPARAADAGESYVVTKIRFHPREGQAERMKGGRFTGSLTGPTNDFETILQVKDTPAERQWTEVELPKGERAFRYVKWEAPPNSDGNIAEIEFYAGDRKLDGTPFGTTGATDKPNNDPKLAFDGNPATYFEGAGANFQYVGLDLGEQSQVAAPTLSVPSGQYESAQEVAVTTTTPGADLRYTIDGGTPGRDARQVSGPVKIEKSAVLQAVARKPGLADSVTVAGAYRIGGDAGAAQEAVGTFHIGNSLTDTVDGWMAKVAESGGHPIRFHRFTIPGAPTDWLWEHPGGGFGDGRYMEAFLARAPLAHLVTQPFAGHGRSIDNEAEHSGRFYDAARKHSPDLQHWLYVQWPSKRMDDSWAKGKSNTKQDGKSVDVVLGEPAKTWQEAVANHVKYTEHVKAEMDAKRADEIKAGTAKPALIIPAGAALAELMTQVEAGKVPGMTDFFADNFSDDLHLSSKGRYLVTLVHYSCFFKESPEGKVTSAGTELTDEQAKIYQRIAWDVASKYEHSGIGAK